ncbi:hypothetical protein [Mesorhizobium sp. M7A.F.Ca.US.011.01.1.1]|uniref:hypothetical protein n=1 Tax=Mesorhizobium sp. M7A.F.Ca.US.011.01.1.1 TaxID=2496741 RepID=UPI00268A39C8
MARTKPSKHLSQAEIDCFVAAAEALHKSIVKPLLSPMSEHYRALQNTHEALLKAIKDITGKDAPFIRWNGTGPVIAVKESGPSGPCPDSPEPGKRGPYKKHIG